MTVLKWDLGTAYDLFLSLRVLNQPINFGLRPSWAAGARSRLPLKQRQFLESNADFLFTPLHWIYQLPTEAKLAGETVIYLSKLDSETILPNLFLPYDISASAKETLAEISTTHKATQKQASLLQKDYQLRSQPLSDRGLQKLTQAWSSPAEFGELYKIMLLSYYESFFAEEEVRILPVLKQALQEAQEKAANKDLLQLVEDLSQGVDFQKIVAEREIILVPSYWSTPLMVYRKISPDQLLMLFGCRPADQSLIPSESVQGTMLSTLKALSDPTRLQTLQYLAEEPLTPSALARKLRLRPPTVTHHLHLLRLAGLVKIELQPDGEKKYTLRKEAIHLCIDQLSEYLKIH